MPVVIKKKKCAVSIDKAFDIVKNFERYPEFLPWCAAARLQSAVQISPDIEEIIADLVIKYTLFSEVFTTKVTCNRQTYQIDIDYLKGPFKHLHSYWKFNHISHDQTEIEFMINFEMTFHPLQKVVSLFFEEAMKKMIQAFEDRFKQI